jgi:hypothetical protein
VKPIAPRMMLERGAARPHRPPPAWRGLVLESRLGLFIPAIALYYAEESLVAGKGGNKSGVGDASNGQRDYL